MSNAFHHPKINVRRGCEDMRQKLCATGFSPLVARVMAARDITDDKDAAPPLRNLPPPDFLPDINRLCDLLAEAIAAQHRICVVGDYDADGMSATALAVDCLQQLGAVVSWTIPDRQQHGYGLHSDIVEREAAANTKVLLTVDNGISAVQAVARAKELGLIVCITDHHLPDKKSLPPADCIVNPQLSDNTAGKCLAGVGVIFYVMAALRRHLGKELDLRCYLDLVALGTVADCVPLNTINRALVSGGLAQMRQGKGRPGLMMLANCLRGRIKNITCRDLAFRLAPRINAAGRFNEAEQGVLCLLAKEPSEARQLAAKLDRFNSRRIDLMKNLLQAAQAQITDSLSPGLVVADKDWPCGMLGLLAGQLCDMHNRPTLVFGWQNGAWRGSGRAPKGWHLHKLISTLDTAGNTLRFGGHAGAVGLTVADVDIFTAAFMRACDAAAVNQDEALWVVDAMPPVEEITPAAVEELNSMVWGMGFPSPQFADNFWVAEQRPLNGGHLRLVLFNDTFRLPAIYYNNTVIKDSVTAVLSLTNDPYTSKVSGIVEAIL